MKKISLTTSRVKTSKQSVKKKKRKPKDLTREFVVMNEFGEFFSGMRKGYFYWSPNMADAKPLERIEQFNTIKRHEPLMEMIYEYV